MDKFINKIEGWELRDRDKDCYDLINDDIDGVRNKVKDIINTLLQEEIADGCISDESGYTLGINLTLSDMTRLENCMQLSRLIISKVHQDVDIYVPMYLSIMEDILIEMYGEYVDVHRDDIIVWADFLYMYVYRRLKDESTGTIG